MDSKTNQNQEQEKVSSSKKGLKPGLDRVTFIVKEEVAFGIKYIKTMEGGYIKDKVNDALVKFIVEWEKENHKIPEQVKK